MFFAGANSIFNGDKLLTTPNPEFDADTVRGGCVLGWVDGWVGGWLGSALANLIWVLTVPSNQSMGQQWQALFEAVGLKGKPAHKAPQETPYPVERLLEEAAQ